MKQVFVSHASADHELVHVFVNTLLRNGRNLRPEHIFYSSGDDTGVRLGDELMATVRAEVNTATLVVAIITPTFLTRPVCMAELGAAWGRSDLGLIPLLLPGFDRDQLRGILSTMFLSPMDSEAALDELAERVTAATGVPVTESTWGTHKRAWLKALGDLTAGARWPDVDHQDDGEELARTRTALQEAQTQVATLQRQLATAGLTSRTVANMPLRTPDPGVLKTGTTKTSGILSVAFVSAARDLFTANIFDGCRKALEEYDDIRLSRPEALSRGSDTAEDELNILRALRVSIDAIIFRPSGLRAAEQFEEVRTLMSRGVQVVLLGDGLPDVLFTAAGLEPPMRVFTPALDGARILVAELGRLMRTRRYDSLVLLSGPLIVAPQLEQTRVAAATYLVGLEADLSCRVLERSTTRKGEFAELILASGVLQDNRRALISVNSDGESFDEVADFLEAEGLSERADLVGYGGARDGLGTLVASARGAVATVDTQPFQRGHVAASALASARAVPSPPRGVRVISARLST